MARKKTGAIVAKLLAGSEQPETSRAAYRKPELECLGSECTEVGIGALPDGLGSATFPIS